MAVTDSRPLEVEEKNLPEFSVEQALKHVRWLTDNTPNRISGGGQDAKAAAYIVDTLNSYGLEASVQEFDTYTSSIGSARLEVLGDELWTPEVRPCLHIENTPAEGFEAELVAVGPGGEEDYVGKDVRGKIVLAEVSYSPATPEKARLAHRHGAAGMILMNWGRADQDFIPWRALKAVWGNPTRETWEGIPRLFALAVTRRDGERLKALSLERKLKIRMHVSGERRWARVGQPVAWLRAPESSPEADQFVVVSGHLDAWEPGVTDNATGNAVQLELARVLAQRRAELKRSVVFCFWNGHEIAEAAGSTYFVDTHWEQLNRSGVAYLNIDSVGMKGADHLVINSSPELSAAHLGLPGLPEAGLELRSLQRIGDQSFFGVGVPSIAARHGFPAELVREWNGATLGWWNHTEEDTFEQLDESVFAADARFWSALTWRFLTSTDLPFSAAALVADLQERLDSMVAAGESPVALEQVGAMLASLQQRAAELDAFQPRNAPDAVQRNRTLLSLSRALTSVRATVAGRYGQDSYGLTDLQQPLPLLAPLIRYRELDARDPERQLLLTELLRARQRLTDAVSTAEAALELFDARVQLGRSDLDEHD